MTKTLLSFFLFATLSSTIYSQISYEKGYYISSAGQKVDCFIKNVDWKNNPLEIEYKLSENSTPEKATINNIKEFAINGISKYQRHRVNIDRSSKNIKYITSDKNPVFKEEVLFLKVLIEGKSNLYEYVDGQLKRFFYNKDGSLVEQLIYKKYKTSDNRVGDNNKFRQQLWVNLKCGDIQMNDIEKLDYNTNELTRFFTEYNQCTNSELTSYLPKQQQNPFHLSLRPRLNSSSVSLDFESSESSTIDFDNQQSFGFGLEIEYVFPFNKNKWAIALEPTYQSYSAESTVNVDNVVGGILDVNVDYTSIELPLTLRHYLFLDENSKIFLNVSYVFDFSSGSSLEFVRADDSILNETELDSKGNVAFGLGYKFKNRYSAELRYQTSRELLGDFLPSSPNYDSLSFILGVSLF
ncbi:PorT family protein [Flagellimonas meridianipacifica]|uniref:Outer membrane autotransporter protein n=1 Tax=Flagellimonas meridianipacifica TaxID=1080225 RepID=A0A2T0MGH3_9FLAO|nr:PorT family protein [Allomuricauda pacifica]PRX56662.1 outer membrane autotransporter protein [Allomuricauda pacifica]